MKDVQFYSAFMNNPILGIMNASIASLNKHPIINQYTDKQVQHNQWLHDLV